MADLVRHAVGVDLLDVALRQALGEDVPDDVALPRFTQPLAIRFLTAEPGPLPTGRGRSRSASLDACSSRRASSKPIRTSRSVRPFAPCAGTATAEDTSSPSPTTADRGTRRAEHAAKRLQVEVATLSCSFDLTHYAEILEAAKTGGYRFATFGEVPSAASPVPPPRHRPLARRRSADGRARGAARRDGRPTSS